MGEITSYGPFEVVGVLDRVSAVANLVRALDDETGEPCLVEWFTRGFSSDPARMRAFERVARHFIELEAPGLLPIQRFAVHGGHVHLVHPWVEATSLRYLLAPGPEDPRPSFEVAGHVLARVCEALAPVHAVEPGAGAMPCHGNVVAERVLVGLDGRVRVAGAGTAQAMHEGERDLGVRLELATRPPEVLAGEPPSPAGDVYQTGLLLYELVVGRPAFHGGSELELRERIRCGELLPPRSVNLAVPEELGACAMKALSLRPEDRFADAAAMGGAIQAALRSHGLLAGRKEVSDWTNRVLGDEARTLKAPAARRPPRRPSAAQKAPPSVAPLPEQRVEVVSTSAPRTDPSMDSLEIELEGNVERDDPTLEIDSGELVVEPSSVDVTLEGLEAIDRDLSAMARMGALGAAVTTGPRVPPKAPPPRPQTPPDGPAAASPDKPAARPSQPPQPPPRPSDQPPPMRHSDHPPPMRPSDQPPPLPDATRRADPTPAGVQRKVVVGARLASSTWGRRVASTLDLRRGPSPQRILYGDSTEFPPGRDFLVIVSSAVETLARAGAVEQEVHSAWETIEAAEEELRVVDAELEALAAALAAAVSEASEASKKKGPFTELAQTVKSSALASVAEARREEKNRVDRVLSDSQARIARATSDLEQAVGAFMALDPIELLGVSVVIEATAEGTTATIQYAAQQGLSYAYEVDGSQTEGFRKPRRVSELAKGIELQVGLKRQLFRKTLVPETVRLDDLFLRRLEVDSDQVRLTLASKHQDAPELFEIELWTEDDGEPPTIRHRPQGEHGAPEEITAPQSGEAIARLRELKAALVEAAQEPILVQARRLVEVQVEGAAVVGGDLMYELAHRIALEIGPTVAEIARRSPSTRELALKVEDTGGLRQERYLERARLAQAFAGLPEAWQSLLKVLHV